MTEIEAIRQRLASATDGDWSVVEDEYYHNHPCTPDGCLGHSTGKGTWVDGPAIVEVFEGGLGETDAEMKTQYVQACDDATFIANAPTDIKLLLEMVEKAEQKEDEAFEEGKQEGYDVGYEAGCREDK